jgi:hypothetical protein
VIPRERASEPSGAPGPIGRPVRIALIVTLALHVVAWGIATNWLWGVSALHAWPPFGVAILVAVAISGLIPAVGRRIGERLTTWGRAWERAGWGGDLLAAALFASLLLILKDRLRFPGDFSVRVGLLDLPVIPPGLLAHVYPLDLLINVTLPRALWRSGMDPAQALQLVGAVVGGAFALVTLRFLRGAGATGAAFPAAAIAALGGGLAAHFAGYDKFGPLLLGLAIAALGALELSRHGRGYGLLAAGVAIAILSHRSGYLVLPAAFWCGASAARRGARRDRVSALIAAAALLVVLALMLPRTLDLLLHFDRSVHLPGSSVARARTTGGGAARLLVISDVLNALFFLVPLWAAGCVGLLAARRANPSTQPSPSPRRPDRFSLAIPALLVIAPFLALLLVVRPGGGWARDWDVATGAGTIMALVSAYGWISIWRTERSSVPAAFTIALATGIALWGIHANETLGIARIQELVASRPPLSDAIRAGALDFLGARALNAGRAEEGARWFEQAIAVGGPNPRLIHQSGLAWFQAGRFDRARSAFERAASLNHQVADPWLGLARIALAERDTARAAAMLDSVVARNPADLESARFARMLERARIAPSPAPATRDTARRPARAGAP